MQAQLKQMVGQTPWDRTLRLIYADCLEEQGELAAANEQRAMAHVEQRRPARGRAPGSREDTYDKTANSATYRKHHKRRFAGCDRCPWHGGENTSRRPARSSWKKSRKQQWRTKEA
jgi:uncharacterized protein (TIGR02996 family)